MSEREIGCGLVREDIGDGSRGIPREAPVLAWENPE